MHKVEGKTKDDKVCNWIGVKDNDFGREIILTAPKVITTISMAWYGM